MQYDVIVVGAGAAGSPLAARLTEDPDLQVLVIEAGQLPTSEDQFPPELLNAGTMQGLVPGSPYNWPFLGNLTSDLQYTVARGKVLGGSMSLNGTYFIRPRVEDFDRWSKDNPAWSYDTLLPVMRRMECDLDFGATDLHGDSGPIRVQRWSSDHPVSQAFFAAADELGVPREDDKNGTAVEGIGQIPLSAVDGVRQNAGQAYLNPVRDRPNLTLMGDTFVRRVVFEGDRASGVEVERQGVRSVIEAGQIVLSAGAVKTPHLLLLSGIGPRAELAKLGIDVVADRPGVGRDFTDHPDIPVSWRPKVQLTDGNPVGLCTVLHRTAEGSDFAGDIEIVQSINSLGYSMTGSSSAIAAGLGTILRHPVRTLRAARGMSLKRAAQQFMTRDDQAFFVQVQQETSRGQLTITSADPHVQPTLDYNYLSTEFDRRRMREAIRFAVELLRTDAFAELVDELTELTEVILTDDDRLDAWMLSHLGTAIHLCGTAKMGPLEDPHSVVDQYGRVHGVNGLRVADTSILPTTPSRGPAAAAVLIGEVVSDFMRAERASR